MAGHDIGYVTSSSGTGWVGAHQHARTDRGIGDSRGQGWTTLRYDTSGTNHYLILKGEGLTGAEEIYVGFHDLRVSSGGLL